MTHEGSGGGGGGETALRPGPPQAAAPLEDEDVLGEILVRLPPLPSSLVRAAAVSRLWGRLAADRAFLRRFRTHHRRPPVLGVFEERDGELVFTPLLDAPDRIPRERFSMRFWHVLGCWTLLGYRHGRVLMVNQDLALLLVFAPLVGGRRGLRAVVIPPDFVDGEYAVANGAVVCAAGGEQGHVHGDCHSGPFKVVLVATRVRHPVLARVYSSDTGEWGDLVVMAEPCVVSSFPSTLVGNALYWWLKKCQHEDGILKFDLDSQTLSVVRRPIFDRIPSCSIRIIRGEHGGVGLAVFSYPRFQIWERMVNSHGTAIWVLRKTARMHSMLQYAMLTIVGYSEDGDALLLTVSFGGGVAAYSFMLQLESMEWTNLNQTFLEYSYHPFAYFYTAGTVRASSTAPAIEPPQQRSTIPAIVPQQQ
ncbi:hypothetical protein CFC21_081598 [Triticum aestivum]|uniref:F-box domain-containing protein n=3 Tax=Triticum TaxID=4564 RepID=A0A9R1AVJ4_TRITD|nr:uncharacterized protein LOC123131676 [Triticum aestivum]KAF7077004.1 hypothetical protein CFC21_081598 [Triticum aestivum]VAI41632.1 unnamed protein product [Triticum turgidum subsp. durum]